MTGFFDLLTADLAGTVAFVVILALPGLSLLGTRATPRDPVSEARNFRSE